MRSALLDTGIALRVFDASDPLHPTVNDIVTRLVENGTVLYFAPQVLFEARVVLTRPKSDNGKGRTSAEFNDLVARTSKLAALLPDPPDLVERWLRLCETHGVVGKRSHDVRLVAWMEAHGVGAILTLNPRDFRAFASVAVLSPGTL